jgi:hypothetical protein
MHPLAVCSPPLPCCPAACLPHTCLHSPWHPPFLPPPPPPGLVLPCLTHTPPLAAGLHSLVATRLTGSPDLFSPQWDADLPGGLAAARRPGMGINALQPPLSGSLTRVGSEW